MLNYFFYYQLAEAYAMNNNIIYDLFKQIVNKSFLAIADRKMYESIAIRSKLFPIALKKWWNSL